MIYVIDNDTCAIWVPSKTKWFILDLILGEDKTGLVHCLYTKKIIIFFPKIIDNMVIHRELKETMQNEKNRYKIKKIKQ